MLVTERAGRLRLMHDGRLASANIRGIPPVDTRTQDGLMDLALHPRFAQNQTAFDERCIPATAHRGAGFAAWRSLTRYPLSRFGNA